MELHFRDILISVQFSDYSFQNPVALKYEEDGPEVGSVNLQEKKNQLLGDLALTKRVDYLDTYPRVAIDAAAKQIAYVFLSKNLPMNLEVKTLKEQISAQPAK